MLDPEDSEVLDFPPAWLAAQKLFRDGYGCEFDPSDPTDVAAFVALLEEQIHERNSRQMVQLLRTATARIDAEIAEHREALAQRAGRTR